MTEQADRIRRLFTRQYLTGLLLIAALALTSVFNLLGHESWQTGRSKIVNLAATQKTNSQRISFLANALVAAPPGAERQELRGQLREAAGKMLADHVALGDFAKKQARDARTPVTVGDIYFNESEPFDLEVRRFLDSAIALSSEKDEFLTPSSTHLREINLLGMDTILQTHDVIARIIAYKADASIARMKLVQILVVGLIILLLVLEAQFIFEPMGRNIRESFHMAEEAKSRAEHEAAKALAAQETKAKFLRMMSHEMRTPLNAVLGMTELLGRTRTDALQKDYIQHLDEAGNHLLKLVNDLLDLNKLEAQEIRLDLAPASVAASVGACVKMLSAQASRKDLFLAFDSDLEDGALHEFDAFRLQQVVINLIGNAIKFTEEGGIALTLRANVAEHGAPGVDDIVLEVKDTGVGIREEDIESIFREYEQVFKSGERSRGGTGLGLAISKKIVEGMNGSISVRSNPGDGSVFIVRLPLERVVREEPQDEALPETPAKRAPVDDAASGGAILVVDDNLANRMIVKAFLAPAGFDVLLAEDGAKAVDACRARKDICLVFMDIDMPVMDGVEATRIIRSMDQKRAVLPIVALTAHALPEDREAMLAAGLTDVVTKPVTAAKIKQLVSRFLFWKENAA